MSIRRRVSQVIPKRVKSAFKARRNLNRSSVGNAEAFTPVTGEDVAALRAVMEDIRKELRNHRRIIEAIRMVATSETVHDVVRTVAPLQLDFLSTMDDLATSGRSFARYGDGEFRLALRPEFNLGFQLNRPEMGSELREVFASGSSEQLLVGFPFPYRDAHWSGVWSELWPGLRELVGDDAVYGTSHVTRPTFFGQYGDEAVDAWRRVWDRQRVCVIAGSGSRFEMIPELFDNVLTVTTIDAPAENAYTQIDRLEEEALESTADVHLLALGPTGTLLAARLAARGRRALDIGHLSASYRTVFAGSARPEDR